MLNGNGIVVKNVQYQMNISNISNNLTLFAFGSIAMDDYIFRVYFWLFFCFLSIF